MRRPNGVAAPFGLLVCADISNRSANGQLFDCLAEPSSGAKGHRLRDDLSRDADVGKRRRMADCTSARRRVTYVVVLSVEDRKPAQCRCYDG